jgi:hypothetical protein
MAPLHMPKGGKMKGYASPKLGSRMKPKQANTKVGGIRTPFTQRIATPKMSK